MCLGSLEPMYRKIDTDQGLKGIILKTADRQIELRVAGYADDTTVYLNSPGAVVRLRTITERFGGASGLRLNENKTIVIALHPDGPLSTGTLPSPLQYQPTGVAGRYLGVQVGTSVTAEVSWNVAETQVTARVALASQKTLTVAQRCVVAAAVIVPKLTYIAQHAWPSPDTLAQFTKMIKNYVWHASFAREVGNSRGWLNADMAGMASLEGGLAIPELRAEVMAMAASAVSKWALVGTRDLHTVGDLLFAADGLLNGSPVSITANNREAPATGSRQLASMWHTGKKLITNTGGVYFTDARRRMVSSLHHIAVTFGGLDIMWEHDAYRVDGRRILGSVYTLATKVACQEAGQPCLEWLPYAGMKDLLLHHDGDLLSPAADFVSGSPSRSRVKDITIWHLESPGILWFKPMRAKWDGDDGAGSGLVGIIVALLTNFPWLLTRRIQDEIVHFTAVPADHPITARLNSTRMLTISTSLADTQVYGPITHHGELEQTLIDVARAEVRVVHVRHHPHVSRQVTLWEAGSRRVHRRKHYKNYVRTSSNKRGQLEIRRRADQWKGSSREAADGLRKLEWTRIRRIIGLGPWGEQVLYRVKASAFSMYDVRNARLGCPHHQCRHEGVVDMHHVFWSCPAAFTLRRTFMATWRALGISDAGLETAIFGLTLVEVPIVIWEAISEAKLADTMLHNTLDETVTELVGACWRYGSATYFHGVWRWRVQHYDETNNVKAERHRRLLSNRLRIGYQNMPYHVALRGDKPTTKRLQKF